MAGAQTAASAAAEITEHPSSSGARRTRAHPCAREQMRSPLANERARRICTTIGKIAIVVTVCGGRVLIFPPLVL